MFKIEKFRENQEKEMLNFVKEKECFSAAYGSIKVDYMYFPVLSSSANNALEPGLRVAPVVFWLYVNHPKFTEAGPGNMSYVCPDKIGESLCLIVVDEAYCIEFTGKTNNFHLCCRCCCI